MLRTALPALLVAALAGGCTSSPDERDRGVDRGVAPDPAYRNGLAELFAGDHASRADTAVGTCFADALLERASLGQLAGAGVLVDGAVAATLPVLPRSVAEDWVDAQLACTDFVAESTRAQVAVTKGRIDQEQYAACLRDALPRADLRAALVGTLTGDWDGPEVAALTTAQADCSAAATPPPAS